MSRHLPALVQAFLVHLEASRYSPRSLEGYRLSLARLLEFLAHQEIDTITDVTPSVLAACQSAYLTRTTRAGRPLGQAAHADFTSDVRMFFRFLLKRGLVLINPAQELEVPRSVRRPPSRVPNLAEMKQLLAAPNTRTHQGIRDRAMIEVLYSTGVRVSEMVHLNVHDINLTEGELFVRFGKGGRNRLIPVGKAACLWIQRYLQVVRPALLKRPEETALFLSARGRILHRILVARLLRSYGRAAGIQAAVGPHAIRHAFATHMLRGRASLRHLQEMLGHRRLTTTQIYTRVEISDLKEVHRRCHPRGRD